MTTLRSIRMALTLITTTAAIALAGCTSDVGDHSDAAEEAVGETSQAVYDATYRMQCYYRQTLPYDLTCKRVDIACGSTACMQWQYTFSTGQSSYGYYSSSDEVNWGNCTFSGTKATTKSVDVKALWNGLETSLRMYCE